MRTSVFKQWLAVLVAGGTLAGLCGAGWLGAAEFGDVGTLDDFAARWQEHHRMWSGGGMTDAWESRNVRHTGRTRRPRTGSERAGSTTATYAAGASTATTAAANALNPHSVHEGFIVGTVREAMMVQRNQATGAATEVPRLVLVGWAGDRAYLPESSRQQLVPLIGKMAKIDCVALVLTSYTDGRVCHDLVVEKVVNVAPYVAPEEKEAPPAGAK
jgi:hypothetical protein